MAHQIREGLAAQGGILDGMALGFKQGADFLDGHAWGSPWRRVPTRRGGRWTSKSIWGLRKIEWGRCISAWVSRPTRSYSPKYKCSGAPRVMVIGSCQTE